MTVRELIRKAAKMLDRSGIEDAKQEAEALFLFASRMSRAHFLAILDEDADEDSAVRFLRLQTEGQRGNRSSTLQDARLFTDVISLSTDMC